MNFAVHSSIRTGKNHMLANPENAEATTICRQFAPLRKPLEDEQGVQCLNMTAPHTNVSTHTDLIFKLSCKSAGAGIAQSV